MLPNTKNPIRKHNISKIAQCQQFPNKGLDIIPALKEINPRLQLKEARNPKTIDKGYIIKRVGDLSKLWKRSPATKREE